MWKTLLLLPLLVLLPEPADGAAPKVYRWHAADGTVIFSDRPQGRAAEPANLAPVNLLAVAPRRSPVAAAPVPQHRPARPATDSRAAAPPTPAICEKLRAEVEALWRQRRRGYPAAEGQQLRSKTRQRQQALRDRCGVWR